MATRFSRTRRGITARLAAGEVQLLDSLFADVVQLLADDSPTSDDPLAAELGLSDLGLSQHVSPPADPAVARLLPDASPDPDSAGEFRRFTERGLRRRKIEGLVAVRRTLLPEGPDRSRRRLHRVEGDDVRLRLDDADAQAWVVALTDLRLVLAERLGVRTEADADALHARVRDLAGTDDAPDDPVDDSAVTAADEPAQQPVEWLAMVYDFVSWLQESLTEVLLADLPPEGDGRRPVPPRLG